MAFIHNGHKNIRMLHGINEITVLQSFRCHIQEVQLSFASFVQYLIDILFRAGHINIIGRNVMLLQRLHLIVDQSKQWFDDDSQLVGMSQTNRFVDNLFARTRGSNDDCVCPASSVFIGIICALRGLSKPSCLSADFKCLFISIEITSNVIRLSLCYRNVKDNAK